MNNPSTLKLEAAIGQTLYMMKKKLRSNAKHTI